MINGTAQDLKTLMMHQKGYPRVLSATWLFAASNIFCAPNLKSSVAYPHQNNFINVVCVCCCWYVHCRAWIMWWLWNFGALGVCLAVGYHFWRYHVQITSISGKYLLLLSSHLQDSRFGSLTAVNLEKIPPWSHLRFWADKINLFFWIRSTNPTKM